MKKFNNTKRSDDCDRTLQSSFTLMETLIAISLLVFMILEVSTVQGNAITLSNFNRKATQATYLAKAVMSQIEYKAQLYPLKDLKVLPQEQEFTSEFCPKDPKYDCDFRYKVEIVDWDLPLIEIITGGSNSPDGEPDPMATMIKEQVKQILGKELLKVATVEVFWPEGSKRNSVSLSYLLTAQKVLDEKIEELKPVKDKNECGENEDLNSKQECVCVSGFSRNAKTKACEPSAKGTGTQQQVKSDGKTTQGTDASSQNPRGVD